MSGNIDSCGRCISVTSSSGFKLVCKGLIRKGASGAYLRYKPPALRIRGALSVLPCDSRGSIAPLHERVLHE